MRPRERPCQVSLLRGGREVEGALQENDFTLSARFCALTPFCSAPASSRTDGIIEVFNDDPGEALNVRSPEKFHVPDAFGRRDGAVWTIGLGNGGWWQMNMGAR